jgi:hypothetical protein
MGKWVTSELSPQASLAEASALPRTTSFFRLFQKRRAASTS